MSVVETGVEGLEAVLARRIVAAAPGQARDAEAELYRLLAPRARRYGLRHLRDPHAADDLMQHVISLTLEQLRTGQLREPERVLSFVLGACRLTVLELRRGARRREELLQYYGEALLPDVADDAPWTGHQRVADCLQRLPERERSVVLLSFIEEREAGDVGAALGLSAGNVRVIRHRAIARLRDCVESTGANP
ncbi:sigma-70 family RNA polymerase sigma factor [Lysobacter sp. CFH 32150]|uniref:RNA polymerase sigma factor n=1 Tax=Lysobacter sp. CFH 32150 TaxID=2927128 RepID=UPI001FA6FCB8|nr:sigma-70 family RNA polymerase sigma factor [Lysobacter sp. CFH 32150]MCI4568945.1 sigma-70 family RNA polymerase sigma factor [Lysobacter sp. CFH 32150]